jgi:hypothetical protein
MDTKFEDEKTLHHQSTSSGDGISASKPDRVDPNSSTGFLSSHEDFVRNIEDTVNRTQDLQKKFKDVLHFTVLLDGAKLKNPKGVPLKKMRPEWEKIDKVILHLVTLNVYS